MKTKIGQAMYYDDGKYWIDDYGRKRQATPEEIEETFAQNEIQSTRQYW